MARYAEAVDWIANNDECTERDAEVIAELISVVLVADLWQKEAEDVAADVLKVRKRIFG